MNRPMGEEFRFLARQMFRHEGTFAVGNIRQLARLVERHRTQRSDMMRKLILPLVIGASALFATAASAAPLSNGPSVMPDNGIENVRMVCDDTGRCYRTHGGRRVVIERDYSDSYNYAPRDRYYRGGYGYYDSGPSVGVGIGPGGVGFGVGVGPRW
jgi:hypothetical protein